MNKDVVCAYHGILLHHKKKKIAIDSNMDGFGGHYANLKQVRERQMYDITDMWSLKSTTN